MEFLSCYNNNLTTLDLSGLSSLSYLECSLNPLTSLNLSGLTSLKEVRCNGTALTALDLTGSPGLEHLSCGNNNLTTLELAGLANLKYLYCYDNNLTTLDLTGSSSLEYLYCYDNNLTSLDLTGSSSLKFLSCYNNNLTTLDVSGLSDLEILSFNGNEIYDISSGAGLTNLIYVEGFEQRVTRTFYTNDVSQPISTFTLPEGTVILCGVDGLVNQVDDLNPAYQTSDPGVINASFTPSGGILTTDIGVLTSSDGSIGTESYVINLIPFQQVMSDDITLSLHQSDFVPANFENPLMPGYTPAFSFEQLSGEAFFSLDPVTGEVTALSAGSGQVRVIASTVEDPSLHSETIITVTVLQQTYSFIEGTGQTYDGTQTEFRFKTDGNYADFTGLQVNGIPLDPAHYTAEADGTDTVIYIDTEYLDTLANGEYTLTADYLDGSAETNFFVDVTFPPTIDIICAIVIAIVIALIAYLICRLIHRKK